MQPDKEFFTLARCVVGLRSDVVHDCIVERETGHRKTLCGIEESVVTSMANSHGVTTCERCEKVEVELA